MSIVISSHSEEACTQALPGQMLLRKSVIKGIRWSQVHGDVITFRGSMHTDCLCQLLLRKSVMKDIEWDHVHSDVIALTGSMHTGLRGRFS